jgi:hypothetical protein
MTAGDDAADTVSRGSHGSASELLPVDDGSAILLARLERARRRVAEAPVSSPDWDAATELVLDLERRLAMLRDEATSPTSTARDTTPVAAAVS